MTEASIDQVTLRRRGIGLIAHDRKRAFDGYTLFAPALGDGTVYLIDMDGTVAHTWRMPYPPGMYGRLLPSGNLFYCGKTPATEARFPSWPLFKGGVVLEADWQGNVLWELRHPDNSHEACLTVDGTVIMVCVERLPPEMAERVQGGIPGSEGNGGMWVDRLIELTREGEVVWDWHAHEHLDPERHRLTVQERREEWSHANSVEEMPDGSVLISFRHISTVAIIERKSGDFRWLLGPPTLAQQHAPTLLENGNILLLDNGVHRLDSPLTYSRVLEIDPKTNNTVWTYQDQPFQSFFNPFMGNAQRLPNGNTLITDGSSGRVFEVTPQREAVWEYVSPYFIETPMLGTNNWLFRAYRYSREDIQRWSGRRLG